MNEILGRPMWAPPVFGSRPPTPGTPRSSPSTAPTSRKAVSRAASRRRHRLVLLDDRTAGRFGPEAVRPAHVQRWRRMGHQRLEVLLVARPVGDVSDRHGPDRSRSGAPSRVLDVLGPEGHPGVEIERNIGITGEATRTSSHGLVHYDNVRVPARRASRWCRGRLRGRADPSRWRACPSRHARRWDLPRKAFDMMCERALSRTTQGSDSRTSSTCRVTSPTRGSSCSSSGSWCCKPRGRSIGTTTTSPYAKTSPGSRSPHPNCCTTRGSSIQVHGALGISNELRLGQMLQGEYTTGFSDGPSEVHKTTVAAPSAQEARAGTRAVANPAHPHPERSSSRRNRQATRRTPGACPSKGSGRGN